MKKAEILSQYAQIKEFRNTNLAAVDTLGSSSIFNNLSGDFENKKFLLLTSLLLSARTNDKMTYNVMMKIVKMGLTAEAVSEMSDSELGEILTGINFRKRKIVHVKNLARLAQKDKLPESIDEVLKIKGVGTKLGYMYMQTAFGVVKGISIDSHCHR